MMKVRFDTSVSKRFSPNPLNFVTTLGGEVDFSTSEIVLLTTSEVYSAAHQSVPTHSPRPRERYDDARRVCMSLAVTIPPL